MNATALFSPLRAIDPLELARGALSCLSYETDSLPSEVHIGALSHMFEPAQSDISLETCLSTISTLREAENLGFGYWIPAPTRIVPLWGGLRLFISAAPTTELQRFFPVQRGSGAARFLYTECKDEPLAQQLLSWLGTDGLSAKDWAKNSLESASDSLSPSIGGDTLSAFAVQTSRTRKIFTPAWAPINDPSVCRWRGISLVRRSVGPHSFHYFLGRVQRDKPMMEGLAIRDYRRMQYGLADLVGRKLTVYENERGDAFTIRLPLQAPKAYYRLLIALAVPDPVSFGRNWSFRERQCCPITRFIADKLGCEVVTNE